MDKKYYIARKLRQSSTKEERVLWQLLRNRKFKNLKFKRQFPIGNYIMDFVCEEIKLIIELDGGQHNEPENIEADKVRTEFLEIKVFKVIRFQNKDINLNIGGVYEFLLNEVEKLK